MKYFLTGSSGFIGSNLNNRLNGRIYLYNKGQDTAVVGTFKPDVIFHLAGEIYVDERMIESNILLTHRLLEEARKLPELKAFIYVGSSSEYGAKDHPMTEVDYLNPRTMYEATKGACTLLCQAYARSYGVPVVIARPFSVYGKYEPEHRFIPTIIKNLLLDKAINIAPGVHDFIHVDDFIDGLLLLAQNPKAGEIFNFGTGIQTSNEELVNLIEKVMKKTAYKRHVDQMRVFDSQSWVCDNTKARSIGWKPKIGLQEGLTRVIKEGK